MNKGKLISLEGIDFTGKTSISQKLQRDLTTLGYEIVLTRDPPYSITPWKDFHEFFEKNNVITKLSEALLLLAARIDNFEREIKVALDHKAIVVTDRYIDSWYAYQSIRLAKYFGNTRQALDFLIAIHQIFIDKNLLLIPDLTVWIYDKPHNTIKRAENKQRVSKYENLPTQIGVNQQYYILYNRFSSRIKKIDAQGKDFDLVYRLVKQTVIKFLE